MTEITVNSPGVTTLTNNTNKAVDIRIPKGTILEGALSKWNPIETTENININEQVILHHKPLSSFNGESRTPIFTCPYCNVPIFTRDHTCPKNNYIIAFYSFGEHEISIYKLAGFIQPELNIKNEINNKLTKDDKEKYCKVDKSCDVLKDKLKGRKIVKDIFKLMTLETD